MHRLVGVVWTQAVPILITFSFFFLVYRVVPRRVVSTAHAAKFPEAVEAACGVRPELPDWLAHINERPEQVTALPADQSAVEQFIVATSRAAQQGAAA